MPNVVLFVTEDATPENATIFRQDRATPMQPLMTGEGDINLLCGGCGFIVAEKMLAGQIRQMVIECPRCRALNATRT